MKKITLLAVAFVAVSFASCKKEYKCVCTTTTSFGSTSYVSETTTTAKSSKKAATAWCDAAPKSTTTVNGVSQTGGTTPTCAIK